MGFKSRLLAQAARLIIPGMRLKVYTFTCPDGCTHTAQGHFPWRLCLCYAEMTVVPVAREH